MQDASIPRPTLSDRSGVTDAVRVQILATEHWSLLAARSMTWNEMFSRAAMFLTVLSASVVTLALVGNATGFGSGFRSFALLLLPVVLVVGLVTYSRLSDANIEDMGLLIGMNRLRHAYLELAPELEPYFVTGHHDDEAGIAQSYGTVFRLVTGFSVIRALSGTPELVAIINSVVAGALATLVTGTVGVSDVVSVVVGVVTGIMVAIMLGSRTLRRYARIRRDYHPRFPNGDT